MLLNPIAVTLADEVRFAPHPLIVPWTAQVQFDGNPRGSNSLAIRLFDPQGKYLFQDQEVYGSYSLPGMLFSIAEDSIHLESMYIRDDIRRQGLGKAIIEAAIRAARKEGLYKMTTVADPHTDERGYWIKVHGFGSVDPVRPDYLELHLH